MCETNKIRYGFEYFTLDNYHKILQIAKDNGFIFTSYQGNHDDDAVKYILWRHDVEFCPFTALKMAEIEAKEGIIATYFFQLHAECYNVFEKAIADIVHKVRTLGHDIALHFDSHFFNINNENDMEKYLSLDCQYFNAIFNEKIKSFSFHNTDKFIMNCEKMYYADLINVYSRYFKDNFTYCSDSTGYWRYEHIIDLLNNPNIKRMQVLTHDAMWSDNVLPPRRRVFAAIDRNALRVKQWYDDVLKQYGAKNVDWHKVL
jgi:hypothetical protein